MVTVFTKNFCQPCRLTKDTLKRKGVEFVERNVEDDPEAYEAVKALGYQSVPVVVAPDGSHWNGLRPDLLGALA